MGLHVFVYATNLNHEEVTEESPDGEIYDMCTASPDDGFISIWTNESRSGLWEVFEYLIGYEKFPSPGVYYGLSPNLEELQKAYIENSVSPNPMTKLGLIHLDGIIQALIKNPNMNYYVDASW